MARSLVRELRVEEVVHHKNGLRNDNRIENRELCVRHPPGQRVGDLVAWAKAILEEHEPEVLR
jgi:hypothetical protein